MQDSLMLVFVQWVSHQYGGLAFCLPIVIPSENCSFERSLEAFDTSR